MPQEIDGEGGENPPLCRNRVVSAASEAQSECQPGSSPSPQSASHRLHRQHTIMIHTPSASRRGAFRVVPVLVMAGSCAFAQARPEATASSSTLPEAELPPVTVSAHDGRAVPCTETGVSVSVLDIPELKKEGIISLSEALTTVPGVYVLPGGGLSQRGNTSNLVIRGMNSQSYTLPMLDGMPVDTISGDGLTLSNLVARAQLFDLGTAEILKGTQGALYGSGAMGGVLYL